MSEPRAHGLSVQETESGRASQGSRPVGVTAKEVPSVLSNPVIHQERDRDISPFSLDRASDSDQGGGVGLLLNDRQTDHHALEDHSASEVDDEQGGVALRGEDDDAERSIRTETIDANRAEIEDPDGRSVQTKPCSNCSSLYEPYVRGEDAEHVCQPVGVSRAAVYKTGES